MRLVLGPQARTNRTQDARVAELRLPAPEDGRSGEGQRLTPDAPHNGGGPPPTGDGQPPAPKHAAPTGYASRGDSAGLPHLHARSHSTWAASPDSRPEGGQPGEGKRLYPDAPHNGERHPPRGRPSATPTTRINGPQGVGPVLGPHANANPTQDTRVAEPRLRVPEDGQQGGGQRLTPDARHNGGRPPPPGTAPTKPATRSPTRGMRAKGTVLGPHTRTPAPTARG